MRNIKIVLQYEGTNYYGWQIQPDRPTIQGILEDRLFTITGEKVRLIGAGRTDARVHALNQVANFKLNKCIDLSKLKRGLNSLLPPDIVVKDISEVDPAFHSRRGAKSKVYCYLILDRDYPSPFYGSFSWFIPIKLDVESMKKACPYLIGEKDFSCFSSLDSSIINPIRKVLRADVYEIGYGILIVEIEATAFLRYMVRAIVGALVRVGKRILDPEKFSKIIETRDRNSVGMNAPARGLFLKEVKY